MSNCIFCNTSDNLNTQFTITVDDGKKVVVHICDEHAETATVKTAKDAYVDKDRKIQELLAQAKALGLDLTQNPSGLVIAQKPQQPVKAAPQQQATEVVDTQGMIDTSIVDRKNNRPMRSVGGSQAESHLSYNTAHLIGEDKLPEEALKGVARVENVVGRDGQIIAIPTERHDGLGSTHIRIRQGETDATLQRRFKNMADRSRNDMAPDFSNGYADSLRPCPMCRGAMKINGKICQKCNGVGEISLY